MKSVEKTIENMLKEALYKAYGLEKDVHIEKPKDETNGDYSTNLAMTLAKELRKNPHTIAETIIAALPDNEALVEKVEVARPGFINFFIDKSVYFELIGKILNEKTAYGAAQTAKDTHINIEFVSVNPTGDIHVGHARGAAAGDSMARIMKKAGYAVTKEYYVNDAGNQIHNLARSIDCRYRELFGEAAKMPEDGYYGTEIIGLAKVIKNEHEDRFLKEDGHDYFRQFGVDFLLDRIKKDLMRFNVTFDVFFSEQSLYDNDEVEQTLETLREKDHTYEEDGALWLKTSQYGDEKDRVIVKSDGTYTYLMPDIAYHKNKLSRGFDKLIDILGGDHHGYIPRLKAAIQMLGGEEDTVEVDILQMVKVLKDGEEVKMSKRSGRAITLSDLIDEAGADAIRYFFARHSLNTHMDLDLDLAIRKTNENPVFYAQYAHARIVTLLKKAAEQDMLVDASVNEYKHLSNPYATGILAVLAQYPSVIEEAAERRIPHRLARFIHDLAQNLHSFYSAVPIIGEDRRKTTEALNLLEATRIVLKDALDLLGVSAPERM